ncbi:MAG: hypothetical protein ABIN36_12075 [Ferruginibacter sp.]
MRKNLMLLFLVFTAMCIYCLSCARGISTYDAANGKAKCGRYVR